MSNFTTKRDATEAWFSNGLHHLWTWIVPIAKDAEPAVAQGLAQIATAAVRGAVAANGQNLGGKEVAQAALNAAQGQLKTVGLSVGTQELTALATAVEQHVTGSGLNPTAGTAPSPPPA